MNSADRPEATVGTVIVFIDWVELSLERTGVTTEVGLSTFLVVFSPFLGVFSPLVPLNGVRFGGILTTRSSVRH